MTQPSQKASRLKNKIGDWFPEFNKEDQWRWADYIEFLCLVNRDSQISASDFVDRWEASKLGKGKISKVSLNDYEEDEEEEEDTANNEGDLVFKGRGKLTNYSEQYFDHIKYRSIEFGEYYPFVLSSTGNSITLAGQLSAHNRVYLFLMFCSLLGVMRDYQPQLTSDFESFCFALFENLFPSGGQKYLFAAGNTSGASLSRATLSEKIKIMSEHIKESVRDNNIPPYNKGDGGLDIYGFTPLGDDLSHFPIYFAQCACTAEWQLKQYTATASHWRPHISLSVPIIPIIFVPFSFRSSSGEWFQAYDIKETVLIDRKRLFYLFSNKIDTFDEIVSKDVIDEILTVKDDIV